MQVRFHDRHRPAMTSTDHAIDSQRPDQTVTAIIVHHPRRDSWLEYERWLVGVGESSRRFEGYLSTDVIRPVGSETAFTVIIRFAGIDALQTWMQSDVRRQFLQRVEHVLEKGDRYVVQTGLDFWFMPQTVKPPVRWKQFLLTLSAIFPLTVVVPALLAPLLGAWQGLPAMLIGKLLVATCIVGLMVYVIMPRYTRMVATWLYR
jgi:antibiotic biosynthesis monooxygenase (ABM) superfamily enzyme